MIPNNDKKQRTPAKYVPRIYKGRSYYTTYTTLPNRHVYTFISGKVCLLASIKFKRQTLPEINVHTSIREYRVRLDKKRAKHSTIYIMISHNLF